MFLDDLIKPIESAISGVESAVTEVEKLFGEAEEFISDIIQTIKDIISEIRRLCNVSKVEYIFIHPFKEAALTAIGDLDKLVQIAIKAGAPSSIEEDLETPIKAIISKAKSSLSSFESAAATLIQKIKDRAASITTHFRSNFDTIRSDVLSFPSYLDDFGHKIEGMMEIQTKKAFKVATEIDNAVERKVISAEHKIESRGSIVTEPLTSFKKTVETRMAAERSAIDLIVLIIIGLIAAMIAGVYMLTKSVKTIGIVAVGMIAMSVIVLIVLLITG